MNGTLTLLRSILPLGIVYLAVVVQTSDLTSLVPAGLPVDVLSLAVTLLAALWPDARGLIAAGSLGLLADGASSGPLGTECVLLTLLAAAIISLLTRYRTAGNWLIPCLATLVTVSHQFTKSLLAISLTRPTPTNLFGELSTSLQNSLLAATVSLGIAAITILTISLLYRPFTRDSHRLNLTGGWHRLTTNSH